jgi:RHS repeat-associated protein
MHHGLPSSRTGRLLALLLCANVALLGCPLKGGKLLPLPGLPEYQEPGAVDVPGGRVNVMGGNLMLQRVDLSIDTRLGTRKIGASYNSAVASWHFDFDLRYDGASFLDPTGASHDVTTVAAGDAIPGTVWVVVDDDTLKTKGGLVHEFDVDGRLGSIYWSSSSYPRLSYLSAYVAGAWRTTGIQQCTAAASCSPVFTIGYDSLGRVVSILDRAGRQATFSYDASGHLASARDGLDVARGWPGFRYEYASERLTALTNSEGERIEYAYDGSGRLLEVRQVGEGDPIHRLAYLRKSGGLYRTRLWDPVGRETHYRYDGTRRLHEVEHVGTGELTVRSWVGVRPAAEILPQGSVTQWTFGGDDMATRTDPGGNVTSYVWNPDGVNREAPLERPLALATDLVGVVESRSYDAAGRLTAVTHGGGDTTLYGYGAQEQIETITMPDGVVRVCEEHGEHGHPLRIRLGELEEERVFDAVGNLLEGTHDFEPRPGGVLARQFDEDRNLVGIQLSDVDFLGRATQDGWVVLEHGSDGRRLRIERPGGGDHEFVYDALGRLVERRERADGAWRATLFAYDQAGRITSTERPNGMREELDFDVAGRIVGHRALRNGSLEQSAAFVYAAGLLASVEDTLRDELETFGYDAAGRLAQITHAEGETLALAYDLRGRRIREDYRMPGGALLRSLDFSFDGADRETLVVDAGHAVLEKVYAVGRISEIRTGNGLVRSFAYDPVLGILTGSSTLDAEGAEVEQTTVTRSVAGGLLDFLEIAAATTTSAGVVATTSERYFMAPNLDDPGPWADAGRRVYGWIADTGESRYVAYDVLGNPTSHLTGPLFVYNAEGNRLLSASPHEQAAIDYTYDEAGFVTSRGGVPLGWTATGQLASYGGDVTLEWDVLGRPRSLTAEGETRRWRFGGRVTADAAGNPAGIDLGEVRIDLTSGTRLYRHFDFRQNVKFVTDDAGLVVAHYRYAPYEVDEVLGADDDGVRFVGRAEIGDLAIFGARIYDPAVGRFLSQDPILGLVNQYAYASGNPVWFVDPDGLQSDLAGKIEDSASGVAFVAGTAALIATGTAAAPFFAGVALGIGGLAFALMVARRLSQLRGATSLGTTSGCSPTALAAVPRPGWPFQLLLLLQLGAALVLLRRRGGPL